MLMTTGTRAEEQAWRQRLRPIFPEKNNSQPRNNAPMFEFLDLKMKSLGRVFKVNTDTVPGARPVVRRTKTTLPPKTPMCQVIIKNTRAGRESLQEASKLPPINRSKSLQDKTRIYILAPSRGERSHLESQISDVWTRDTLFCTGLTTGGRSGGHLKRPSAKSIMRKINVTNITGTFGRRSISRSPSHKATDKTDPESPRYAALPPLVSEVDLSIKVGLGHMLSKRHGKTDRINITVRERDSTDTPMSLDKEREEQLYALAGSAGRVDGFQCQEIAQPKPVPGASVPRYSMTRFIEEMGHGMADHNKETNKSASTGKQHPLPPPVPWSCQLDTDPPSTVQLSVTDSAGQMMMPLALQTAPLASPRQPRHWLGRPLHHHRSFHRSQKAAAIAPG